MLKAYEISELIFMDGQKYGDNGANHLCDYSDDQRTKMIEDYAHQSQNYMRVSSEDFEALKKFYEYLSHNLKNRYPKNIRVDFLKKLPIITDGFATFGKGMAGMGVMNVLITQIHMTIGRMIDWYESNPDMIIKM